MRSSTLVEPVCGKLLISPESAIRHTQDEPDDFRDAHRFDPVAEVGAILSVAVAEQIARSGIPRERFGHLAR